MHPGDVAKRKEWEDKTLKPALNRKAERIADFQTASGIPVDRLYTPDEIGTMDYDRDLGYPGQFPFTRGVQPTIGRDPRCPP